MELKKPYEKIFNKPLLNGKVSSDLPFRFYKKLKIIRGEKTVKKIIIK